MRALVGLSLYLQKLIQQEGTRSSAKWSNEGQWIFLEALTAKAGENARRCVRSVMAQNCALSDCALCDCNVNVAVQDL